MTRRMVSRRLALVMAIMLLLSTVCQAGYAEASKTEAAYQKAIGSLSLYMRDVSAAEVELAALYEEFDGMHHYRMSTEFSLYVQILQTSLDKGTQRKTTENELPSLTQCTA